MPRISNIKRNRLIISLAKKGLPYSAICIHPKVNLKSKSTVHWIIHNGKTSLKTVDK